jgi:hypothetical protein
MDLNEMKNRLASMQSKQSNKGGGEQKKIFFKPSIGKQIIRVVPAKANRKNPFTEMYFHYGITNNTMVSPTNWGEKDPIVEFAKQLRKTSDKENWRLAKKLDPKMRVFIPIIVRGEEAEGVKLWQFGKELYMDFLNLADNEDVGDFTDVMSGRDITLTTVGPEVTGTAYNKTTIMPKVKETPLAGDKPTIEALLENQPDPMSVFKRYSYDEMKQALQTWLTPTDEDGGEEEAEAEATPTPAQQTIGKGYALKTPSTQKENKAEKFDALFDEGGDDDDLPF